MFKPGEIQPCSRPENGCFAADLEAHKALTHPDEGISTTLNNVFKAAVAAGEAPAIGKDNIIYTQVRSEYDGQIDGSCQAKIVPEETPARVHKPGPNAGTFEGLTYRVAEAAYQCGGCPDCPLRNKKPKPALQEFVGLSATANLVHTYGRQIMGTGSVKKIGEGTFSSCPETELDEFQRLLWASNEGVPLVEVSIWPVHENQDIFERMFGADSQLVHRIVRSEATENYNQLDGPNIPFEQIELIAPFLIGEQNSSGLFGDHIVTASLAVGHYFGYEYGEPDFRGYVAAEGTVSDPKHEIQQVLNRALSDAYRIV